MIAFLVKNWPPPYINTCQVTLTPLLLPHLPHLWLPSSSPPSKNPSPLLHGSAVFQTTTYAVGACVEHSAPSITYPPPRTQNLRHGASGLTIIRFKPVVSAPKAWGNGKLGWRGNPIPIRALSVSSTSYTLRRPLEEGLGDDGTSVAFGLPCVSCIARRSGGVDSVFAEVRGPSRIFIASASSKPVPRTPDTQLSDVSVTFTRSLARHPTIWGAPPPSTGREFAL